MRNHSWAAVFMLLSAGALALNWYEHRAWHLALSSAFLCAATVVQIRITIARHSEGGGR